MTIRSDAKKSSTGISPEGNVFTCIIIILSDILLDSIDDEDVSFVLEPQMWVISQGEGGRAERLFLFLLQIQGPLARPLKNKKNTSHLSSLQIP